MKIIFEQAEANTPKFGDVQEHQFFVDADGYLCQKSNSTTYHTIADSNGQLYCNIIGYTTAYDKIKRILPKVTKIEF